MASDPKTSIVTRGYDETALSRVEPDLRAAAASLAADAQAANTRRVYASSWRAFEAWCEGRSIDAARASPEIVALHLTDLLAEGLAPTSLARAYNAIADRLRTVSPERWPLRSRPLPCKRVIAGAFRTAGRPPRRVRPLLGEHFVQLARWPATTLRQARNRALLMLGFAGAFRRSELVALDREDLELSAEGLKVLVRRSKTDQEGRGLTKGVLRAEDKSVCVIAALADWIRGARVASGPLFRRMWSADVASDKRLSDDAVADVVKAAVMRLGLDPDLYAGHSLRCGFVTTAALQGADLDEIMAQTGHASVEQVREYIRRETVFQKNATAGMFDRAAKGKDDGTPR